MRRSASWAFHSHSGCAVSAVPGAWTVQLTTVAHIPGFLLQPSAFTVLPIWSLDIGLCDCEVRTNDPAKKPHTGVSLKQEEPKKRVQEGNFWMNGWKNLCFTWKVSDNKWIFYIWCSLFHLLMPQAGNMQDGSWICPPGKIKYVENTQAEMRGMLFLFVCLYPRQKGTLKVRIKK